jgi:hypothetical protein
MRPFSIKRFLDTAPLLRPKRTREAYNANSSREGFLLIFFVLSANVKGMKALGQGVRVVLAFSFEAFSLEERYV